MFLLTLRDCHITRCIIIRNGEKVSACEIQYRCKKCYKFASVILTDLECNELRQGLPYRSVFSLSRRTELLNFEQGLCNNE